MSKYFVLLLVVALGACTGRSPQPTYYTLAANNDAVAVSQMTGAVDVARVRIPEYIDRPQMVTTSGVQVNLAQDNRWAERLAPMMQRKLIQNIGAYLPRTTVKDANFAAPAGDYAVFVEIYELNGQLGDMARMVAAYSITGLASSIKPRTVQYSAPAGDTYDQYAISVSQMMDKLSRDISNDIATLN